MKKFGFWIMICLSAGLFGAIAAQAQLPTNPFNVRVLPVSASGTANEAIPLQVEIDVPPGHYLYADTTKLYFVTPTGFTVKNIRYPVASQKEDPFLGKMVSIYDQTVVIEAQVMPTKASKSLEIQGMLAYQGCSPSICFRRVEEPVTWRFAIGDDHTGALVAPSFEEPITPAANPPPSSSWTDFLANPSVDRLLSHGHVLPYLFTFVGGVLTSFTPCVLPMLPVILLIIGVEPGVWRRNLWLSTCLALGMAVTAAITGAVAAVIGLPLAFLFQQRWFVVLVIALFIAMALAMFGVFTIRLPQVVQQRLQHLGGRGPRGAFLAGISTGLLATPCAGPVVAALIGYVSVSGNVLYGFSLLLTYGLGFALMFVVVGTFYGQLAQRLPRGAAVRVVKVVLGILLLLPAGYYSWVLIGASTQGWYTDVQAAYSAAQQTHRPILLEFTAKSCPPCLVMERTTFRDPNVVKALTTRIVPLRLDMTFPTAERLALADQYGVVGWPALLFATPEGEILTDLSLVGKIVPPEQLLQHIEQARARVKKK